MTGLTHDEVARFVGDRFVHLRGAFPRSVADEVRKVLWEELGLSPDDRGTWTQAVVRLPGSNAPPFDRAVNSQHLHRCFDQLVGRGRWVKRSGLGTFPVRFPDLPEPDDTGWHCDGGFGDWPSG